MSSFAPKNLVDGGLMVGLITISSMLTCGGRLAIQTSVSAMSPAVNGRTP